MSPKPVWWKAYENRFTVNLELLSELALVPKERMLNPTICLAEEAYRPQ